MKLIAILAGLLRNRPAWHAAAAFVAIGALALLDAIIPSTYNLILFYSIPVTLLAVRHPVGLAVAAAVLSAAALTLTGNAYATHDWQAAAFNFVIRSLAFGLIIALGVAVKLLYRRQQEQDAAHHHQLSEELEEKRAIIDEIHHRVKNQLASLQMYLYTRQGSDQPEASLDEAISRIGVLSLLYDQLTYQAVGQKDVRLAAYVGKTLDLLRKVENLGPDQVRFTFEEPAANQQVNGTTMHQVGLLIHELVTNSVKYVVNRQPDGYVQVHLRVIPQGICISVSDNGPGFDFENTVRLEGSGLGMQIAKGIARQLGSPLLYSSQGGSMLRFCMPRPGLVLPDAGDVLPDEEPPRVPAAVAAG